MKEQEIIIVNNIPEEIYKEIVIKAIKYSLISFPFTINRMHIPDLNKRIHNISKGKIAEGIFEFFCIKNNIDTNFKICQTPFYLPDKRDFICNNSEWDIKNNFIYHDNKLLTKNKYTDLPALIPASNQFDQWGNRDKHKFNFTKSINYIFTFMKASGKNDKNSFFDINLSSEQIEFITKLSEKYNSSKQNTKPFDKDWFWEKMKKFKNHDLSFYLKETPYLVITGYANNKHWDLFKITDNKKNNSFNNYASGEWYKQSRNKKLSFLNGTIITRIPNATTPVSYLPAFSSLFPRLRDKINYAKFK